MNACEDAPANMIDDVTRDWSRNQSDYLASGKGCRFDVERGSYAVFWIERYCKLYEGEQAGEPLLLHGCKQCGFYGLPAAVEFPEWDDEAVKVYAERARRYSECVEAGHERDWQYEVVMRLFGWVMWGKRASMREPRWIRRFTDVSIWVSKKNKKSPTGAALGLYLTCGDGEQGQKVFCLAKNGEHARKIMGEHAVQMLKRSPELDAECNLNKTTYRISYLPTTSYIEPISSANSDNQKAQEGINGSTLTDETHVVDWAIKRRISRAGISRAEPLNIEVSTAGDDPDSYGKSQFDLAAQVISGEVERQEFFAAIYAAPQGATDAEIDANIVEYAKMANPAMGHTVDLAELLRDYESSKRTALAWSDFKKYRLNIWQAVAVRWISQHDWAACKVDFTEDDMAGMSCSLAIDLAQVWDMTAAVFSFPMGEGRQRVLPFFLMPERGLEKLAVLVPGVLDWRDKGFIITIPGDVTDYRFLKAFVTEKAAKFAVMELVYDPWNAEQVTQEIADEVGIPRFTFPQSIAHFNAPTKEFERLVVAHMIEHNGNPVLVWQMGNACVKTDANANKRPIKPAPDSPKKVDGVIASIMAVASSQKTGGGNYVPGEGM